ncbi:hypothetical protein [uncultured Xylophilus sp.]|nr:hypothetical protein [uncultured Xylophilus sp.]
MSKTRTHESEGKPKPRYLKRMRQREAMQQYRGPDYPLPDPPAWKPLG